MAYLIAKRIYQGELIPLLTKRMVRADAERKLGKIRAFPGVLTEHVDDDPELWFEIEEEWGDLAGLDPVCFPGYLAYEALARTGVKPSKASRLLSDEYAAQWLVGYHSLHCFPAAGASSSIIAGSMRSWSRRGGMLKILQGEGNENG